MIVVPSGAQVWLAAGVTDMRRGLTGLSALVQTALADNPYGGHVCLFAKRLERGKFVWPRAENGTVALTRAQLSMLLEGIDWRRPTRTAAPQLTV
jgi:transposase